MAYTFSAEGTWGSYSDNIASMEQFHKARERLGFTGEQQFPYLLGTATLYSRLERSVKWNYSYVCLLQVGTGGFYWVWISDLPGVFAFLREIGARKQESGSPVDALVEYLQGSTYFAEAMHALYDKMRDTE